MSEPGKEHSDPDFSGYTVQFALAGQMCQAIATASEEEAEEIHESLSEIEAVEQPRVVGVKGDRHE